LEHDCILPSGESLCRQYLYGQRYFEKHFGQRCKEAWLPDTFGYASQLPQILRLAGIENFFTQKVSRPTMAVMLGLSHQLSWNNINVFPHSTFNWVGIDGSQVLSHMTPVDSYHSQVNFDEIVKGVQNSKTLEVTDQCLLLFGNGDGGGGPTPWMLEKVCRRLPDDTDVMQLERLESVTATNPELPSVKPAEVSAFWDSIRSTSENGRSLPTWRGELYFELHRGVSQDQSWCYR
jgi:alpha-mannosidase